MDTRQEAKEQSKFINAGRDIVTVNSYNEEYKQQKKANLWRFMLTICFVLNILLTCFAYIVVHNQTLIIEKTEQMIYTVKSSRVFIGINNTDTVVAGR